MRFAFYTLASSFVSSPRRAGVARLATCAAFVPILIPMACDSAASQSIIPDAVSCRSCSVSAQQIGLVGDLEGPGALARLPRFIHADAKGTLFIWADGLPQVFERSGKFLTTLGRPGEGPGELRTPTIPFPLPGDSTLVVETTRASVFGPNHQFVRLIRMSDVGGLAIEQVRQWPDSVLLQGLINDRRRFGFQLHLASFQDATVQLFGSGGASDAGDFVPSDRLTVAASRGSDVWSFARPYRLTRWDKNLKEVQEIVREPNWWVSGETGVGSHRIPPLPYVKAASVDEQGLVWVFINIPAPDWQTGWVNVPEGAVEIREALIEVDKLYDTLVEVIDPTTLRVVTTHVIDGYSLKALPGRQVAMYAPTTEGHVRVKILQLSLRR